MAEVVDRALAEDLGPAGDVTAALIPAEVTARFALRARRHGVLAGRACATETFRQVDPGCRLDWQAADGDELAAGDTVVEVTGPLRPILTAERTALNFLGHLSGVATLTAQYVEAAHERNPAIRVLDTRKTTPGLRALEKAAVRAGGGGNHRASLSEAVLVKDNHLAGISITDAVARARALVAGAHGRGRVRRARAGGRGGTGRGRRRAARQHGRPARWSRPSAWPIAEAAGPVLTEVSGRSDPGHRRRLRGGRRRPDLGGGARPIRPRCSTSAST